MGAGLAAERQSRVEASKPKALTPTTPVAHDVITVLNEGTKIQLECHLNPGHAKSLINISETGDQYGKFQTHRQ
jgi:hypothetical protein